MGSKPRWSLLHLFLFPFLTLEEDCVEACVEDLCRGVM